VKTVYFVQAGNLYGHNAHLPYAAGCVAANAFSMPEIRRHYQLGEFIFLRTPIEEVLAKLDEPYMVAFSCYIWNMEYHKALASAIKARWPGCYILFGGHQVNNDNASQLHELPDINFLIHRAGEEAFAALLLALQNGDDLAGVPSLSYRNAQGEIIRTAAAPCTRCDYPSPYLEGLFDSLFAQYPHLLFSMTLETNRGCPNYCAFCDWGADRQHLKLMPMQRVQAEIDWAAQRKLEFVLCADANFGLLPRDTEVVQYLANSKRRCGYPQKLRAFLDKSYNDTVFSLNETLAREGLSNGAALSLQSISSQALEAIGRKNLNFAQIAAMIARYNAADIPVYCELILGLPGETLQSFAHGVGELLAAGMHGALEIFRCEVLPNARLAEPAYQAQHGIKTVRVQQYHRHESPENHDSIPEYSELVTATTTMPVQAWVAANVFADVVQGLHALGLLPHIAEHLHRTQQLRYEQFYLDLIAQAQAQPASLLGELVAFTQARYEALAAGDGSAIVWHDAKFGNITWPLGSAIFLRCAYESTRFYAELPALLAQYDLPQSFIDQQQVQLNLPSQDENWPDFARVSVWYNRRRGALSKKAGGA